LNIQNKVLCRKLATKRVEDDEDKQSVCSQVLVRQISQLPNATSGDSLQLMKVLPVLLAASASTLLTYARTAQL
jgi:hypothetical protein